MTQYPIERMTRTSMSLAILAIFSTLTFPVVLPYIFGSVALILAIISKGSRDRFPRRGRRAAIVASAALVINTALIITTVLYFFRMLQDSELRAQFSQTLYQMYGITIEELLDQIGLQSGTLSNL